MKKLLQAFAIMILLGTFSCNSDETSKAPVDNATVAAGGQEKVNDDASQKDVVKVAMGSKDHSTLVAAVKQAELVTALSNAGPFTVFAPVNAAFDKLPAGTVDALMKDDKKADLQNILQYHVAVGVLKKESFTDGQKIGMVNGDDIIVTMKDGKVMLNNSATIVATVPASNGIVYVIDAVLLPPAKK
ncbi:MAG: fasciclin domain-containing protein [Bacteroidota bacterium]